MKKLFNKFLMIMAVVSIGVGLYAYVQYSQMQPESHSRLVQRAIEDSWQQEKEKWDKNKAAYNECILRLDLPQYELFEDENYFEKRRLNEFLCDEGKLKTLSREEVLGILVNFKKAIEKQEAKLVSLNNVYSLYAQLIDFKLLEPQTEAVNGPRDSVVPHVPAVKPDNLEPLHDKKPL